jgi:UDPglucose--hexose-1-phosphate uridylyltransferase
MSHDEMNNVLHAYKARYVAATQDRRLEQIVIFKNHGASAGTSLEHPHSQLIATPVVPQQVRNRIEYAMKYFDTNGSCLLCDMLKQELAADARIILATKHFVSFIPFAAISPFHTWIFPRRHMSSFREIQDEEISDLAVHMKTLLSKLYIGLGDPDYNYSIRSVPLDVDKTKYFHWYIGLIPRVTKTAGFELGSGMFINTALPEESAAFLRHCTTEPVLVK